MNYTQCSKKSRRKKQKKKKILSDKRRKWAPIHRWWLYVWLYYLVLIQLFFLLFFLLTQAQISFATLSPHLLFIAIPSALISIWMNRNKWMRVNCWWLSNWIEYTGRWWEGNKEIEMEIDTERRVYFWRIFPIESIQQIFVKLTDLQA